jgi:hypothetical protein
VITPVISLVPVNSVTPVTSGSSMIDSFCVKIA